MGKSLFEQFGGTYTRQGDYLLPDLTVAPQEDRSMEYGENGGGTISRNTIVCCTTIF